MAYFGGITSVISVVSLVVAIFKRGGLGR